MCQENAKNTLQKRLKVGKRIAKEKRAISTRLFVRIKEHIARREQQQ